ncbi:MAG TPA: thioredoxin family protein [Gaiellaceae bacterium]|nr:thioredoxin family protein [Gaiellaceae bacterium]
MKETSGRDLIQKPRLVYFHSRVSGRCRRVDAYLAQVLQRRQNHETFAYYSVAQEERPDLLERFGVALTPTLVVIEGKSVSARLESPRSSREIAGFLAPWLN